MAACHAEYAVADSWKRLVDTPTPARAGVGFQKGVNMTDEEAGYLAENLWLYRVRRRMSRKALAANIMLPQTYRDYEYGTNIPSHEEVALFAARLQTTSEALTQAPDYKWLMGNYRVRKVLEFYCLLKSQKQRRAVIEILRGLQE